jgi:hypothetical protein
VIREFVVLRIPRRTGLDAPVGAVANGLAGMSVVGAATSCREDELPGARVVVSDLVRSLDSAKISEDGRDVFSDPAPVGTLPVAAQVADAPSTRRLGGNRRWQPRRNSA